MSRFLGLFQSSPQHKSYRNGFCRLCTKYKLYTPQAIRTVIKPVTKHCREDDLHKPFLMELPGKRSRQTTNNSSYNQASISLRIVIIDELF